MKTIKCLAVVFLCTAIMLSIAGCGSTTPVEKEVKTITIAYQGGMGYAPIHVMETLKLIEKNYNGEINVVYQKLNSGAAINEGIIGGTIDIGCMGISPAISGVAAGIPYKAISGLCAQSHGLMSNDPSIKSLQDIKSSDKIAIVSAGSFQALLLAMACEEVFGDAHYLENNIQGMSNADGMAALESGTVTLHLTSTPYIYQERSSENYVELPEISSVWPVGYTHTVAMASTALEKDETLFKAVDAAFKEAIDYINNNTEEAIKIESEYQGLDVETITEYMSNPELMFFNDLNGSETMASFMHRAGYIEKEVTMDNFKFACIEAK